ncbi:MULTISPECIES: MFS transporter [unclassified Diaminobutyricimonas]|uniref:MFS transporter n=1 Tax=unclassified Diaminobutyricimonas TaxID=2643261 RepID=UPI0012F50238|nr:MULTISPECIES: MFS transporter [unclassified Diaminobutyricimonas]
MALTTDRPDGTIAVRRTRRMQTRAAVSGTLGSALEWFDFAVYGALSATLFPALFFSDLGETGALLASFASFGVGFVARPLGGIIFGYLGDRYGRRPILLVTFIAMGVSSVIIGLLPTGQGIGIAVLLVALRFIQGFSLGGEATGAQLMTMEHTVSNRRGLMGAFINVGSPLSQVLANLTLAVLTLVLTTEQWEGWGWRIPFLMSIALVAVGVYIRLRLEETPAFVVQKQQVENSAAQKTNGLSVLKTQPLRVLQLTLAWGGAALTFYLVAVYGLSYLTKQAGMESGDGFLILMLANGISVLFGLFGGWLSDRIGRKTVLIIGTIGCFVGVALFFPIANTGSFALALLVVVLSLSSVQFAYGAQPAFFAEQFPTASRFSGSALSLTMANLIFAAPAPLVATALTDVGGTGTVVALTLGVLVVSLIALSTTKDNKDVDLATFTELR